MSISIILADDHPIFRDGLKRTLEEDAEFSVLGVGASADDAVALVKTHRPDIALLDLSMPGNGIEAARRIGALDLKTRVAMLTVSEEADDVIDALEVGAQGYVLKGVDADTLCQTLKSLAGGESYVPPALAARVLSRQVSTPSKRGADPIDDLTKREEDILRRVAKGLSNREIADELGLQEKTVKHYMTAILGKLHARNRVEAALIAAETWNKRA
jgi:DNA-binding NarL/FixJ family response regulator